jgi:hypothetical protein
MQWIVFTASSDTFGQGRVRGGAEPAHFAQGGRSGDLEGRLCKDSVRTTHQREISALGMQEAIMSKTLPLYSTSVGQPHPVGVRPGLKHIIADKFSNNDQVLTSISLRCVFPHRIGGQASRTGHHQGRLQEHRRVLIRIDHFLAPSFFKSPTRV